MRLSPSSTSDDPARRSRWGVKTTIHRFSTYDTDRRAAWICPVVCGRDLEGIVAKHCHGTYDERWYKIRNPRLLTLLATAT